MDKSKLKQPEILEILRRNHFRFWYDMGLKSGAEFLKTIEIVEVRNKGT